MTRPCWRWPTPAPPLTADGVQALATLRASAKRGASSLGRFGVGFAAVLAVSDEPAIVSARSGGVRWSRAGDPSPGRTDRLAGRRARRAGPVPSPVLRLPFPYVAGVDGPGPPPGYDTLVRLPLREPGMARALLAAVDPTLPLVARGPHRARGASATGSGAFSPVRGTARMPCSCSAASPCRRRPAAGWGSPPRGRVPADLLADRPVEERVRDSYEIRALFPQGPWPVSAARVFRAPQPTDEPLSLPLVLTAPLPVEPSRRHTVPGALRDFLLDRAAEVVVAMAERLGSSGSAAALESRPGRVGARGDRCLPAPRRGPVAAAGEGPAGRCHRRRLRSVGRGSTRSSGRPPVRAKLGGQLRGCQGGAGRVPGGAAFCLRPSGAWAGAGRPRGPAAHRVRRRRRVGRAGPDAGLVGCRRMSPWPPGRTRRRWEPCRSRWPTAGW